MKLQSYIDNINKKFRLGISSEHTFRGNLETLIQDLFPNVLATNEPSKKEKCGKPDYVLTDLKGEILGYIEAKDIDEKDLEGRKVNKEQFDRYKKGLNNLIFTDYLNFHFYRDGDFVTKIAIGQLKNGLIEPLHGNFDEFTDILKKFCSNKTKQTIRSSKQLSAMMAGKARLLSNVIERALTIDINQEINTTLKQQMEAFKEILIHDISAEDFADIYAQTITYGMFAARLHDPTLPTFSRQEAAELIPKSNPFLRKLFGYIAGPDLDDRLLWIVDDLVDIFLACNVAEILKDYGKNTGMEDPIIHFYENFLSEYDPALRKARGVWYTPQPVVNFIVRAVDEILKTEFHLPQGLADTSKIAPQPPKGGYKRATPPSGAGGLHRVQILDPATGTGTFLAETIKHIHKKFAGQKGLWSNYVENHLLPRLNGFELLMASYAMAHLQLDLLLTETGYKPSKDQRFRVYLTNSLEEHHPDTSTLFANWLSSEANEANHIKRDTPVMCVIGNPPYSVSSNNKSEWIEKLTADYKKDLNERNIQPLSDDYIKFIRFGQHFIDKNGEGILAYISNNSFIDGIIHRQMRKHLMESFDSIYVLDLHGNAKKKEVDLDGSADQNVFDIMQGVSINIFVKTGKKKENELAKVKHFDLQGKRNFKYDFLTENSLKSLEWNDLQPNEPNFFLVKKDFDESGVYEKGFKVDELFKLNACGVVTARDSLLISMDKDFIEQVKNDFKNLEEEHFCTKYTLPPDSRDWKYSFAINAIKEKMFSYEKINYKPFDIRNILYSPKSKGILSYPRFEIMQHFINNQNVGIILNKQFVGDSYSHCSLTNFITVKGCHYLGNNGNDFLFPLYLYPEQKAQLSFGETTERTPNLNPEIIKQIADGLGLVFSPLTPEGGIYRTAKTPPSGAGGLLPIDVLDYIYAVLHSPNYREKYKEFLKIDFPRVPYPKKSPLTPEGGIKEVQEKFWKLVKLGGEIRQIHLLESEVVEEYITQYPEDGNDKITKITAPQPPMGEFTRVYINDSQYFDNVPLVAWNFYIGGYQPAQKWLKDRKERVLSFEDILHYQKIIVALTETARLMREIDLVGVE